MDGKLSTGLMVVALIILSAFLLATQSFPSDIHEETLNMTHGRPDFNLTGATRTTYPVADLGELAARLGSIDTFDRRGDVFWFDDFEATAIKWDTGTSGTGASVTKTNSQVNRGEYAIQLITGNAAGNYAYIRRWCPMYDNLRIGTEASIQTSASLNNFYIETTYYDGTTRLVGQVIIDVANSKITIRTGSASFVDVVTSIDLDPTVPLFHNIKLVVDYNTGNYIRLIVDCVEYDLSSYSMWEVASSDGPYLFTRINVENNAAGNRGIIIDDYILTMNEP